MALISVSQRSIHCQIAYYGFPMSGKSTSLAYVHKNLDIHNKSDLERIEAPYTLHFYYTRPEKFRGFSIHFHIKANRGVITEKSERTAILKDVDGVIFTVDSLISRIDEGIKARDELISTININGRDIHTFPVVAQYNKRDLPNTLPLSVLDNEINIFGWDRFETVATDGKNVIDAFEAICSKVISSL